MARLQSRQISQLHLYQVLHAVRLGGSGCSRAEICELTGLSQAAVSTLTRRLLESQALVEASARPSQGGGRRERELAINPDFAWVVGVKVAMHQVTVALTDFAGGVRNTLNVPLQQPLTQSALVRMLSREIETCLAGADGLVRQRLAGVGVALPGFVDSLRGEVHWCPVLKASSNHRVHRLAPALTTAIGVPVFIENDANMLALAEQWFGEAARLSNVAVVTLEQGLGLGLVVNGELYRGHLGLAAELGHMQVEVDGRDCRCGKRGCLEAYVARFAVVRQGQEAGLLPATAGDPGSAGGRNAGAPNLPPDAIEAAYANLAAQALAGRAKARHIFERQGRLLGQWIGNVITLMAPQRVILDAGPSVASGLFEPALRQALDQAVAQPHRGKVPLILCHQGDEVWARGAAALVLQRLDESAEIIGAVSRHGVESERVGRRPDPTSPRAGIRSVAGATFPMIQETT
jgi:predicted NBD/HSP70 family sugar kinase